MVVLRSGEEDLGFAEEQRLLLGFVADVQHRDVGPDAPGLALPALGIGPDEPVSCHSEVEAVAVDLLCLRQAQRQAAHIVRVSHRGSLRSDLNRHATFIPPVAVAKIKDESASLADSPPVGAASWVRYPC
jgi:hypothetical protein